MFSIITVGSFLFFPFVMIQAESNDNQLDKATFAGGCFWCMTAPFDQLPGVKSVVSGYTGGQVKNPTYTDVTSGRSGHLESIEISFDPAVIRYDDLLDVFWHQIDPTDAGGQFVDRGPSYRTAIFYHNDRQRRQAETSKKNLASSGRYDKPIVTEIRPASVFYPAENYHQDFGKKNQEHYKRYRMNSGRDHYLSDIWGREATVKTIQNPTDAQPKQNDVKKKLTPLQYKVTQENGTEPAFQNEYWNNHREGIYVDVVTGEPLFSSLDKYESGTGWPSFTRPLEPDNIVTREDKSWFMSRTEVRSKHGGSHLGHLFSDGPQPTGLRYCMNSAALKFVPREDLVKEGYGRYLRLFETPSPSSAAPGHR